MSHFTAYGSRSIDYDFDVKEEFIAAVKDALETAPFEIYNFAVLGFDMDKGEEVIISFVVCPSGKICVCDDNDDNLWKVQENGDADGRSIDVGDFYDQYIDGRDFGWFLSVYSEGFECHGI